MVYSFRKHLLGVTDLEKLKGWGIQTVELPPTRCGRGDLRVNGEMPAPCEYLALKETAGGERGFPGVQWKTAEA